MLTHLHHLDDGSRLATLAETKRVIASSDTAADKAQRSTEGTMRDVLLGLADDLSRGILLEWLNFADVARLDSAYNNRALSRALRDLLSSPLTLFDVSREKSQAKLKMGDEATVELGFD